METSAFMPSVPSGASPPRLTARTRWPHRSSSSTRALPVPPLPPSTTRRPSLLAVSSLAPVARARRPHRSSSPARALPVPPLAPSTTCSSAFIAVSSLAVVAVPWVARPVAEQAPQESQGREEQPLQDHRRSGEPVLVLDDHGGHHQGVRRLALHELAIPSQAEHGLEEPLRIERGPQLDDVVQDLAGGV